jgi:hypothetical protein
MNSACRFGTPAQPVGFDKPGVDKLGCNIHESMVGYIYMVDTPHFANTRKSASAGRVVLPAVEYQLRAWHPYPKYAAGVLAHKLADRETRSAAVRMKRSASASVSPAGK